MTITRSMFNQRKLALQKALEDAQTLLTDDSSSSSHSTGKLETLLETRRAPQSFNANIPLRDEAIVMQAKRLSELVRDVSTVVYVSRFDDAKKVAEIKELLQMAKGEGIQIQESVQSQRPQQAPRSRAGVFRLLRGGR